MSAMEKRGSTMLISVILPVYNTQDYVDMCIQSIVNQSYEDIEIIIINDGSTDRSGEICRQWKEKDERIILIEKENEGQGIARTIGIQRARGEFTIFVDSDDYLEERLIEKAREQILKTNADICMFEYNNVAADKKNKVSLPVKLKNASSVKAVPELLSQLITVLWNEMYRTALLKKNGELMSNNVCEDLSFLPLLLVQAHSICTLQEPLYNYRYIREGNMSTNYLRYGEVLQSVLALKKAFLKENLYTTYQVALYQLSFNIFKDILFRLHRREDFALPQEAKNLYQDYLQNYENYLEDEFKDIINGHLLRANYIAVGSYNLRVIIRQLLLEEEHFTEYYGATSLISLMSQRSKEVEILIDNKKSNNYRTTQVIQDIEKIFCKHIELGIKNVDFVLVDFVEEINPIIETVEGYFTKSVFFDEICVQLPDGKMISLTDPAHAYLWKKSCLEFISLLRKSGKRIVLVENLLSEKYSQYFDSFTDYPEIDKIREYNRILTEYYSYFQTNMPEAFIIEPEKGLSFTDETFYFGCEPIYSNMGYYKQMALKMHATMNGV